MAAVAQRHSLALPTGSPWRDITERYGPSTTSYNCFVRWRKAGVWDRILEAISAASDGDLILIDSSCAHSPAQHER